MILRSHGLLAIQANGVEKESLANLDELVSSVAMVLSSLGPSQRGRVSPPRVFFPSSRSYGCKRETYKDMETIFER